MAHPDSIALMRTTCDIITTPPANTGLVDNLKFAYSLSESFKKHVKIDASIFKTLRKGHMLGCLAQEHTRHLQSTGRS